MGVRRALSAQDRATPHDALRRAGGLVSAAICAGVALCDVYLLALLHAACRESASIPPDGRIPPQAQRLVALVPAHDEQEGIAATLASLASCEPPHGSLDVLVIADNCSDQTAARARRQNVEVWERVNPTSLGKGVALGWAFARLGASDRRYDGVIVLDADCLVSRNFVRAIERALGAGAAAVQVRYEVANADASHAAALRYMAFALMNTVRPLGKHAYGLSCGLLGTGMAFSRELLLNEPWHADGLAEDLEYHMRIVGAGERVRFLADACVSSAMPNSTAGSGAQQSRWEAGKLQLIRGRTPRLLARGLRRRDPVVIHAALEPLVPAQSLLTAGALASLAGACALGRRRLVLSSVATLAGQATFVIAGLRAARAPAHVYRSLLFAPRLILGKLALYGRLLSGRGPSSWLRTTREHEAERTAGG